MTLASMAAVWIGDALVIDEPWITKILRGEKTWELRSRHTYKRGWIGLIRKGSGLVVGVANLVESLGPMSVAELRAADSLHRSGSTSDTTSYRYAWVLENASFLAAPIKYKHPPGAVIWVKLASTVSEEIPHQMEPGTGPTASSRPTASGSVEAEKWLADRYERTRPATVYTAGFQLPHGRELALDRDRKRIQIWIADFTAPMDGVEVLNPAKPGRPYSPSQPRGSNLKACTPTLAAGNSVFHLRVNDLITLGRLIKRR